MFKQFSSSINGLVILTTLLLIGVNIVFSYAYFNFYNINTASLDLLNNLVTPQQLRKVNIMGYFLVPKEISHLQDVANLIINTRYMLVALVPISVILLFKWKSMRIAIIVRSWFWLLFAGISLATAYKVGGVRIISGYLHSILFPQGNWMFEKTSLIRRIYSTHVMEHGAIFVMSFIVISLAILTVLVLWKNKQEA